MSGKIDRGKVIKGLEICTSIEEGETCPKECPYIHSVCYGYDALMRDALELLKGQEAVKPKTENDGAPEDIACWWYVCGNCGCTIDPGDDYCRHCGRAVKWDANGEE